MTKKNGNALWPLAQGGRRKIIFPAIGAGIRHKRGHPPKYPRRRAASLTRSASHTAASAGLFTLDGPAVDRAGARLAGRDGPSNAFRERRPRRVRPQKSSGLSHYQGHAPRNRRFPRRNGQLAKGQALPSGNVSRNSNFAAFPAACRASPGANISTSRRFALGRQSPEYV